MPNENYTIQDGQILDESFEVSIEKYPDWARKIISAFPAFRNRNFRLFFTGQFISLIGTWLQVVAQGWLVLILTNSVFLIGLVAALGMLPSLLFSLHAGVIVDRLPKRTILLFTQAASMILAFALGILTALNVITITEIAVLAFLLGTVNSIDIPARQAFVAEIVDKKALASAIALNSGMFNAARVIGPGIAGFLIAWVGAGGAFNLNGVSYVASIATLWMMRTVSDAHPVQHKKIWSAAKEGVRYTVSHPVIRTLILLTGVTSIFGWSYTTILPVLAQNVYHAGAAGLGYLYAANGLGAVLAAVLVSVYSNRISSAWFILGGNALFALGLIGLSFATELPLALIFLFISGIGLLMQFSLINTVIQHSVRNEIRGRVMSIYLLMFLGLAPLGNLEIGFFAEHFGAAFAIRLGATVVFLAGAAVFFYRKKIRQGQKLYLASKSG